MLRVNVRSRSARVPTLRPALELACACAVALATSNGQDVDYAASGGCDAPDTSADPLAFPASVSDAEAAGARCAASLLVDGNASSRPFFDKVFERRWALLRDSADGSRLSACRELFSSAMIRPTLQSANDGFLDGMVKFVSIGRVDKCTTAQACVARLDQAASGRDPVTAVLDGLEFWRPEAAAFVRSLKRMLGLWVHVNTYHTPAGVNRGFGLHSDRTDVIVLQLEGDKVWEVCGRVLPDLADQSEFGEVRDQGVVHRDAGSSADALAGLSPAVRKAVESGCKRLRLREGDVLYLPAGQLHMASSGDNADSLHATIGVARTHHMHTWAGILSHSATGGFDPPPGWLASVLRRSARMHRLPVAVARSGTDSGGAFNALVCAAHARDLPPDVRDGVMAEFDDVIAPALLKKRTVRTQQLADVVRGGDALEQAVMTSRSMMQRAVAPIGMQFSPDTFPELSEEASRWESSRRQAAAKPPLADAEIASGSFQRAPGVVVWLGDQDGGAWRLQDDVAAAVPMGDQAERGVPVADDVVGAVGWALGCYTGAALEPFTLADAEAANESARAALQLLWQRGLLVRAVQ